MFRNRSGSASNGGDVRLTLEGSGIPSFWRTLHESQAELRRCARYERHLSLVVLGLHPDSLERLAQRQSNDPRLIEGTMRRFECTALLMLGWMVRDGTRESDIVTYVAQHHAYAVVLPETDGAGAYAALRRVSEAFQWRASVDVQMGYSVFPSDGLTIEDLYKLSRRLWKVRQGQSDPARHSPSPRPVAAERDTLVSAAALRIDARESMAAPEARKPRVRESLTRPTETEIETRLESNG